MYTMIDDMKLFGVLNKSLPKTTKVGSGVKGEEWSALFVSFDRETGEPRRSKNGQLILNHRK